MSRPDPPLQWMELARELRDLMKRYSKYCDEIRGFFLNEWEDDERIRCLRSIKDAATSAMIMLREGQFEGFGDMTQSRACAMAMLVSFGTPVMLDIVKEWIRRESKGDDN